MHNMMGFAASIGQTKMAVMAALARDLGLPDPLVTAVAPARPGRARPVSVRPGLRRMSVRTALEWAFGHEGAGLDFDHSGAREFERMGVGPEWRMMQQKKLGCRVDCDGAAPSHVHPDAALIAAAVEALDLNPVFGRDMAVLVATCARSGTAPDWRGFSERRVVPVGWDFDREGLAKAIERDAEQWPYRSACRHVRKVTGKFCPIRYVGGSVDAARLRRRYHAWCGALLDVATQLRSAGYLETIEITSALPDFSPWKKAVDVRQ